MPYIIDRLACMYKRWLSHAFVQIYDKVLAVCLPIKNSIFYSTAICSIRINPWGKSQIYFKVRNMYYYHLK